jgi:isoleucyl-tRNA synthetase
MSTRTDDKSAKKSYKETLNLPQTAFPMEAKLVQTEPARLKRWQDSHLYQRIIDSRPAEKRWVLHDGPPFANADIHLGHVINKALKDVVLRFRTMQGHQTPYVPGWDCHGLPIEHRIQQDLGPKLRELATIEVRRLCHDHAEKYVKVQSEQFQRLGVLGEWDQPYITLRPAYEASALEVFARFVEARLVYKQLKPVHWSIANQTALADAELEYKDVEGPSIYVEFPAAGSSEHPNLHYLVWTTTPWTLPANLAIAVHPDLEYAFVRYKRLGQERTGVVAATLVESVLADRRGVERFEVVARVPGKELVGARYRHPFVDRQGPILPAAYVTATDGTGLVHTAPGHGEEDYATGVLHKLEIYCPVLHNGRFDDTTPSWLRGLSVWDANPVITRHLRDAGLLLGEGTITHSYPHDWRSKTPTIFRATEQWFIAVDRPFAAAGEIAARPRTLRQRALEAVSGEVDFVPKWGQARIAGMIQSRPDWCISRQRAWGLPIPVFYNEQGQPLLTPESVRAVARHFAAKGSESWFTDSPAEILGDFDPGLAFPVATLRKEKDIFDVWFESGSSWHAVLQERENLRFPADLYQEGSDQHRGWFQLSLLLALGVTGRAPFRKVVTHGFVVKPDGTKVSKSDKEYVTATQEIERHGADLLRLWCCSVDYQGDIPASPQVIREFGDKYRKIRNTLRYLLSNLYDFDPQAHAKLIPAASLDGWAAWQLDELIRETTAAYDAYQFHRAFRLLHDFCAVQVSAVYGNAMKDRLYCDPAGSDRRRRAQTVMHRMAAALTKLLAPMIVFTADEAWEQIRRTGPDAALDSVHLAMLPQAEAAMPGEDQVEQWRLVMDLRDQALAQLDALKKEAGLNKALDAEIIYEVDDADLRRRLEAWGADLEDLVGAGCHRFAEKSAEGPAVRVRVVDRRQTYQACARSWKRRPDVGSDAEYPDLSLRDAAAVRAYGGAVKA